MKTLKLAAFTVGIAACAEAAFATPVQEPITLNLHENNSIHFAGAKVDSVLVSRQETAAGVGIVIDQQRPDTIIVTGNNSTENGDFVVVLKDGRIFPIALEGVRPAGQLIVSGITAEEFQKLERDE